jgi:molecular chaperone GrpE (heat shock protein)
VSASLQPAANAQPVATPAAADLEALQAQLARMAAQLDEIAAESRRSRERWEAIDELVHDMTPIVSQALERADAKLGDLKGRGYGEVLGAGAGVLDRVMRTFDRDGVKNIGDTIILLLKTLQNMR